MEQRPLRLGDILDDYCPRERRVTNHAVVALVEQDVKQTRCTTCDAEHVYKGGRVPRRKKPESTGVLYKEVLAGITDQDAPPAAPVAVARRSPDPDVDPDESTATASAAVTAAERETDDTQVDESQPEIPDIPDIEEGPVHRPLIRAQLARPEGIKVERQAPEFTIRQNNGRGNGSFRGGGASGGDTRSRGAGGGRPGAGGPSNSNNNGHRFGRGPQRSGGRGGPGGPAQGFGRGPGGGNGGGQQRSGRPPKRSR